MNELTDTEVADLALFAEQAEESDLASLNSMSEEELRNQMFLTYQEYEVYQQSEPADRTPAGITQWKQTIDQKFRRYVTIRKILERLKAEKASVNQAEMSAMR